MISSTQRRRIAASAIAVATIAAISGYFVFAAHSRSAPAPRRATPPAGEKVVAAPTTEPSNTPSPKVEHIVRPQTSAVSPAAPARHLKDDYDDLRKRADEGDAHAATQLYRDLSRCSHLQALLWQNLNKAKSLTSAETVLLDADSHERTSMAQALLDRNDKLSALCEGVGDDMTDALVPSMLQAAQLGDADARDCYVHRGPLISERSAVDHPELFQAYKDNAKALIADGVVDGDWRIVDMLQSGYGGAGNYLVSGVVGFDPVQHYRYLKLLQLGMDSDHADLYAAYVHSAGVGLTATQIADADAWAQNTFTQDFSGATDAAKYVYSGWDACAIPSIESEIPTP